MPAKATHAREQAIIDAAAVRAVTFNNPPDQHRPPPVSSHVWYVSYGSNLSTARFHAYINGGRAPGGSREHPGCRDKTPPSANLPAIISARLLFAGWSHSWGGATALIQADTGRRVLARAWRVSTPQFADIAAQENGQPPGTWPGPPQTLTAGPGTYGRVLVVGEHNGEPVITLTGHPTPTGHRLIGVDCPSGNYLRVIGAGLAETFGLTIQAQADYLAGTGGLQLLTHARLRKVLSTPSTPPHPTWHPKARQVNGRSRQAGPRTWRRPCFMCGESGHNLQDCPQLQPVAAG